MFCFFFSVVSKVCHYVGSFFHYLLASSTENEEEKSVASVSAILFFILALQTGILIFKKNYGLSLYIFWILWKIFKNIFNFTNFLAWAIFCFTKLMIFYFIYSQGLTSLEPEKRFSRICKNLCLLLTALFHFIHNNVR